MDAGDGSQVATVQVSRGWGNASSIVLSLVQPSPAFHDHTCFASDEVLLPYCGPDTTIFARA